MAEAGSVDVASATGEAAPADRSGGLIANTVAARRHVRAGRFGVTREME